MSDNWRLVDSGLGSPARNIALNRALLEARASDEIPSTLRFARFTRCALIGAGHSAPQELDAEDCARRGIAVQRRITSGAASYLDDRQLVWELYLHRRETGGASLRALGKRICHAAATALCALGVDARYRERLQVEVDGREIASGGFAVDADAILFQGSLALDVEPVDALRVLRTPWSGDAVSLAAEAAKRVTSLRIALGRAPDPRRVRQNLVEAFESEFDVEFREADPGLSEHARCESAMAGIDTPEWVEHAGASASAAPLLAATQTTGAGTLSVALVYDRGAATVRRVWLTAPWPFTPVRTCADLEAALVDVPLARLASTVEAFFGSRVFDSAGYTAADVIAVLDRAVRQPLLTDNV